MNNHTARPYWHVDLKWIFGILFCAGLIVAGLLFVLATLTSGKIAVSVAAQVYAGMVSRNGLDDPTDINEFKKKAMTLPGDKVETLPGIFVTKADLTTLTPRELRLKIFTGVVSPYYELGAKGVAAQQTSDPVKQANIVQQAGLLGLLNRHTHDILQTSLWIALGVLLLPLVGLVRFSAGWGRLVSPGIIMVMLTFPSAVVAVLFQIAKHSTGPVGGGTGPIPGLSAESFQVIIAALLPGFLIVFAIGATLLVAAGIGKALSRRRVTAAA